ncbi:lytic transglycosylase domain-containing protein [Sporosarcina sp. GW1-11]|uniref:lytic transglycosylase domain-containing protein n=1 Tax=Sporosarcina sp. GW1-11 TaxID=2899126 RepID=UPI00294C51EB|nr:lytic transglycosylase domain-containing protein [Sporosarcina sp. GW1-11]MDV6377073.1 lytic transglycosylase domain-containing protein [Sporosarcina sp. GW1-11]
MKKRRLRRSVRVTIAFLVLFVPVAVTLFTISAILFVNFGTKEVIDKSADVLFTIHDRQTGATVPQEYIPIYIAAAEEYNIPWTLLAAHHRIETRFSTMRTDVSPVGAEGPMQFMPCTFVGWNYPGCKELGKGSIPEKDKTNPDVIAKYGGYGVDANGDGIADPFDMEDAIFSAANYLSDSGAADGNIEKAVFTYNHSEKYVEDVLWYYHEFEEQRKQSERQAKK